MKEQSEEEPKKTGMRENERERSGAQRRVKGTNDKIKQSSVT